MKHTGHNFKLRFPYLYVLLGYLAIIFVGCALLLLPVSRRADICFLDAFFVSVSSVCITGLTPVVLADSFTRFGQVVILLLIQIGGLGFVTVTTSVFTLFGIKVGLSDQFLMEENMSGQRLKVRNFLARVLLITAVIECFGFLVNLIALSGERSGGDLVFTALFQAVSSFNNAGLDLLGAQGYIGASHNWLFLLNSALLTLFGSLGCLVINELVTVRRWRKFTVHCKIILTITPILFIIGTLAFLFSEWGNITFGEAMFMSVMARSGGCSVVDFSKWKSSSILLCELFMLIGGAPASTAGGIKCTTFFVVMLALISFMRGKRTIAFKRYITPRIVLRSMLITIMTILCIFAGVLILGYLQPEICIELLSLEAFAAFTNAGFSSGITDVLCVASKAMLCFAMFFGRVGCMGVLMLLRKNWNHKEEDIIRYAEADIIVG